MFKRISVAILLLLIMAGGWQIARITRPSYLWERAQQELAQSQFEAARIHLQQILRKQPQHGEALRALGQVELETARQTDPRTSLAQQPQALRHMLDAARRLPDDLTLQEEVLAACEQAHCYLDAQGPAERILARQPGHPLALLIAASDALAHKNLDLADGHLARLQQQTERPRFQTLLLAAQIAQAREQSPALQAILAESLQAGADLADGAMAQLPRAERGAWIKLATFAVDRSVDLPTGTERLMLVLDTIERALVGETSADNTSFLADLANHLLLLLQQHHPELLDSQNERSAVVARVQSLRERAIAGGFASPAVCAQGAEDLVQANRPDDALKLIESALAASAEQKDADPETLGRMHLQAAQLWLAKRDNAAVEKHIAPLLKSKNFAGWGYLLTGNLRLNQGNPLAAIEAFQNAEKQLGRNLLVRAALAQSYLMSERWKEALAQLKTLHVAADTLTRLERDWARQHLSSEAPIHLDELRAQLGLLDWEGAQLHLQALQGTPLESRGLLLVVTYLQRQNQPEQAAQWLAQARARFPHDLELLWTDAVLNQLAGRPDQGLAKLQAFRQTHPQLLAAAVLVARWQIEHGEAAAAAKLLAELRQSVAEGSSEATSLSLLQAQALAVAGEVEAALTLLAPLQQNPAHRAEADIVALQANALGGRWDAVDASLTNASAANAAGPLGLVQAEFAAARGNYALAIDTLRPALEGTQSRQLVWQALQLAIAKQQTEQGAAAALKTVEGLLKQHPREIGLNLLQAGLQLKLGDLEGALESLEPLQSLDSHRYLAHYYRASALVTASEWARAAGELKQSLRLEPRHVPSLLLSATVELQLNHPAAALQFAQQAGQLEPQSGVPALYEAMAFTQLQRPSDAHKTLRALVERLPQWLPGQIALVNQLMTQGDLAEAQQVVARAREMFAQDSTLLGLEVTLLVKRGQLASALEVAQAAIAAPQAGSSALAVALAFEQLGQNEAAERYFQFAAESKDRSASSRADQALASRLIARGLAAHDHDMLNRASEHLRRALTNDPENWTVRNNLIWLMATEFNQADQALQLSEQVLAQHPAQHLPLEFVDTLGTVFRLAHQSERGAAILGEVLPRHPSDSRLHFQLGLLQFDQQHFAEAQQALQTALRLGLSPDRSAEAKRILTQMETPTAKTAALE